MIKSIVWSSTIDYPNQVSTVLFVGICNWRCDFCYNLNLLHKKDIDFKTDILPRLINRKNFINHIIISGGECTCWSELESTIDILINSGFTVGIHSNGSNPTLLKNIINKVQFIGMDIKTSQEKYNSITKSDVSYGNIIKSIELITSSNINYEFRTTVYPKYVNQNDCVEIAKLLVKYKAKSYTIQQFDSSFIENKITPYTKQQLEIVQKECNNYIPTILRGF